MVWDPRLLGTIYVVEEEIYAWKSLRRLTLADLTVLQRSDVFVVVGNETSREGFAILLSNVGIVYCSTSVIHQRCKSLCISEK